MSLNFYDRVARLLSVLPAIIIMTVVNVIISFCTAGVTLLQLLAAGLEKHLSLGVAILVAIGCHVYIAFNHKIREYIKNRSQHSNE